MHLQIISFFRPSIEIHIFKFGEKFAVIKFLDISRNALELISPFNTNLFSGVGAKYFDPA